MSTKISKNDTSESRLTQNKIWDLTSEAIDRGFRQSVPAVIEAQPASGKSYGVIEWAAQTRNNLTVLVPRHDLLDNDYEKWCDELGLDFYRMPSFYRDCESFDEDNEPVNGIAEKLQSEYKQGLGAENLHELHSDLPCQENGPCEFIEKRDFEAEEYDVLLGTYLHSHSDGWIENRYVAFDEFPGQAFLKEFGADFSSIVTEYLQSVESIPADDYLEFSQKLHSPEMNDYIEEWKETLKPSKLDWDHVLKSPTKTAHTHGPLTVLAMVQMEKLDNNWRISNLGEGKKAVLNPDSNEWSFFLPPDLSSAESTIGLDGTPHMELWQLVFKEEITPIRPIDRREKKQYLKEVLEYRFIQTTENWKAIQSGSGASPPKDIALVEGIGQREGRNPSFISSKKAIRQYERHGLDQITENVENYGNLKGMNKFSEERLGVILGNPHPGDHVIKKWSALAGHSAERNCIEGEEQTGSNTDYGEFGNTVMKTFVHDEVLQAAMRFGREEVDGVRGATVYLHTSAIPEWVPVEKQIPEIDSWQTPKNGVQKVIEAIRSLSSWKDDGWRSTDLYDLTELGERQVRYHLDSLADSGYIERLGKIGTGNTLHYTNVCLDEAGVYGHVEFPN